MKWSSEYKIDLLKFRGVFSSIPCKGRESDSCNAMVHCEFVKQDNEEECVETRMLSAFARKVSDLFVFNCKEIGLDVEQLQMIARTIHEIPNTLFLPDYSAIVSAPLNLNILNPTYLFLNHRIWPQQSSMEPGTSEQIAKLMYKTWVQEVSGSDSDRAKELKQLQWFNNALKGGEIDDDKLYMYQSEENKNDNWGKVGLYHQAIDRRGMATYWHIDDENKESEPWQKHENKGAYIITCVQTESPDTKGSLSAHVPIVYSKKIMDTLRDYKNQSENYKLGIIQQVRHPLASEYGKFLTKLEETTKQSGEFDLIFKWEMPNTVSDSAWFAYHRPPTEVEIGATKKRIFHYVILHIPTDAEIAIAAAEAAATYSPGK